MEDRKAARPAPSPRVAHLRARLANDGRFGHLTPAEREEIKAALEAERVAERVAAWVRSVPPPKTEHVERLRALLPQVGDAA